MSNYCINSVNFDSGHPMLQTALEHTYALKERPLCMCRQPGIPMYVAKLGQLYVIKRMPDTGVLHAPHCDSYEPPPELSGLGEVMGQAIKEDLEDGTVALKLDFALTKSAGRAPPMSSGEPPDSVKSDGTKLTLRSVLHYLWDVAGLNKWSPRMEGKRSWFTIHKFVGAAATGKTAKGVALSDAVYIPEPFYPDRKDEIACRREARFGELQRPEKSSRKLMLLLGEVKEIGAARYGHKIVIKQMPDCHFMLAEDVHKRLLKRFEGELALWEAFEGTHLMAIATFGVGVTGVASIEEIALMITTENWIPFDGIQEKQLIDTLTQESRRFIKGMRYNLPTTRPLASVVLSDTQPTPTGMYIVGADTSEDLVTAVTDLAEQSTLSSWVWRVGAQSMPSIPGVGA